MTHLTILEHFGLSQIERFERSVEKTEECWIWRGRIGSNGYGHFTVKRMPFTAHRVAYTLAKGPIEDGLVIDHLCRNRACVNPDHLEPVTQAENVQRGLRGRLRTIRTHCPKGHAIEGYNAMPAKRGDPRCRQCNRDYMRDYMRTYKANKAS